MRRFPILLLLFLPSLACAQNESFRLPAAGRIVAIGDLHGDLEATRAVLRLGGAIDEHDRWIGGDLVVVQTGDQLDRGDQEQEILDLLDRLQDEAAAAGGAVHILNGNHELMNARPDLRYVTENGFADFAEFAPDSLSAPLDSLMAAYPAEQRGRVAAFRPGSPNARMLAERHLYLIVGRTAFVHGGITPAHLEYGLEKLDRQTSEWLAGRGACPALVHTGESPTWERDYSDEVDADDCAQLAAVLAALDVDRMVVGHTVQEGGIRPLCDADVWCIDAGLAEYYGGHIEALEIRGDEVRVLR